VVLEIYDKFAPGSKRSRQLRRFVQAWNEEIAKNGGSMTRRRIKLNALQEAGTKTWERGRKSKVPSRVDRPGVGHTPAPVMGGPYKDARAMALDKKVNSYLGGLAGGVPKGTKYNEVRLSRKGF